MQLEIGKIYEGTVKTITKYGAFVEVQGPESEKDIAVGMVHISEVANAFVNDINEHLTENQTVKVKVIGINENNKVSLSIKKALPFVPRPRTNQNQERSSSNGYNNNRDNNNGNNGRGPANWEPKRQAPPTEVTFEDMMSKFKQNSEEKMCDLKRNMENKRRNTARRGK